MTLAVIDPVAGLSTFHSFIIVAVYLLLLVLLITPVVVYLLHRWQSRKQDILHGIKPAAAVSYFKRFRASRLDLNENNAASELEKFYVTQFGRRLFALPLLLLLGIAGSFLLLVELTVMEWLATRDLASGLLPQSVVLAILGAYMWVVNDQVMRYGRDNIRPADVYWASFRFAIAVPVAYSFSLAFADALSLPMSFLLGSFPTSTIMTVAQRVTAKYVHLTDAPDQKQSELQELPGIDTFVAERYIAEGITTINQLAYYDPMKLTIRTGLGFSFNLSCFGDALFWSYLSKKISIARDFGVNGVSDCRDLYNDLEAEKSADPAVPKPYHQIVVDMATKMEMTFEGLRNLIDQVALDPFTEFQWNCWN
jgi:hypothetical protein